MNAYLLLTMLWIGAPGDTIANLSSADQKSRDIAGIDLELQRRRLEDALDDQLQEVLLDRDNCHDGRTHTVLQAIALSHADNTVPQLLEAVGFTLDPETFPIGERYPTSAYYPVAETLRGIGNKAVITGILSATAEKDRDGKTLRIYAWVLIQILSRDVARLAVERGLIGHVTVQEKRLRTLLRMVDETPLLERPGQ